MKLEFPPWVAINKVLWEIKISDLMIAVEQIQQVRFGPEGNMKVCTIFFPINIGMENWKWKVIPGLGSFGCILRAQIFVLNMKISPRITKMYDQK